MEKLGEPKCHICHGEQKPHSRCLERVLSIHPDSFLWGILIWDAVLMQAIKTCFSCLRLLWTGSTWNAPQNNYLPEAWHTIWLGTVPSFPAGLLPPRPSQSCSATATQKMLFHSSSEFFLFYRGSDVPLWALLTLEENNCILILCSEGVPISTLSYGNQTLSSLAVCVYVSVCLGGPQPMKNWTCPQPAKATT